MTVWNALPLGLDDVLPSEIMSAVEVATCLNVLILLRKLVLSMPRTDEVDVNAIRTVRRDAAAADTDIMCMANIMQAIFFLPIIVVR